MSELYRLDSTDENILLAARLLLRKLAASRTIRPAQLVTVAKLQHVLSVLPRVTTGVTASVSVCCPRHKFGDIETFHWWNFGIEDGRLRISSGGHFYDPQTGGDTFTTMSWNSVPGVPSEQDDYRESLWMVPDVRSYAEGVESIDFTAEEYHIEILDNGNPLLEEEGNQDDVEAEKSAEEWYRKGIAFLDLESHEQAFVCFHHGIEINPRHSMLQFALGQAFEMGIGTEKDDSQAVEWYQKAAEQGLIGAMFFLAQKYEFGQGVQSDPEKAMRWYRNAAEGGLPEAQFALGEHYLCDEVEPLTKHWEEAASWFRKAAEQGHSDAQLRLAGMYEVGLCIPEDLGAAGYRFCKAADEAQEAGKGVPAPWSIKPVDVFETWIASQVNPQEVNAREPAYSDGVEECGICGCNLNYRGLYVNGRLRGDLMWSNMCTECLKGAGEGIGCGKGQLYARQQNGDWRLVAGWCPEEDELPPSD